MRKVYQFNPKNGTKVVVGKELAFKLSIQNVKRAWGVIK